MGGRQQTAVALTFQLPGLVTNQSFIMFKTVLCIWAAAAFVVCFGDDSSSDVSSISSSQRMRLGDGMLDSYVRSIAHDHVDQDVENTAEILELAGYDESEVTDITFNVPNPDEWYMISDKVSALHYDIHVVN